MKISMESVLMILVIMILLPLGFINSYHKYHEYRDKPISEFSPSWNNSEWDDIQLCDKYEDNDKRVECYEDNDIGEYIDANKTELKYEFQRKGKSYNLSRTKAVMWFTGILSLVFYFPIVSALFDLTRKRLRRQFSCKKCGYGDIYG